MLKVQRHIFNPYSWLEYVLTISKKVQKWGRDGTATFDGKWKTDREDNLFCSGYNALIYFRNLQDCSLTCKVIDTLLNTLPIILHGQLFRLIAWDPTTERAPRVHHIGSRMTAMRIASCEPSYTFQQYNVDITWQLKQLIENSTESHKTGDSILVYGTEMHEHWQR